MVSLPVLRTALAARLQSPRLRSTSGVYSQPIDGDVAEAGRSLAYGYCRDTALSPGHDFEGAWILHQTQPQRCGEHSFHGCLQPGYDMRSGVDTPAVLPGNTKSAEWPWRRTVGLFRNDVVMWI